MESTSIKKSLTTPMGKELYSLLKIRNHVLEDYIRAFDNYMDDDNVLRSISYRIGIFIPEEEPALYILYDRLKDYLEKETNPSKTEKLVNMTRNEYKKYLNNPSLTDEKLDGMFFNRLIN